ncbi:MAG TPA: hypothetical protein VI636_13025 [Candidatus Angelobacter sp.]
MARILTLHPDEVTGLCEQLQQLGFDVEVTSPHQRNLATADLEIEFAICDQQQVLGRASAIAAELQADVVVFPGAMPPMPRSMMVEEVPVSLPEPVEMQTPNQPVEAPAAPDPEPVLSSAMDDSGEQVPRKPWSVNFAEGLRQSRRQIASAAAVLATKLRSSAVRLRSLVANAVLKFKGTTSAAGRAVAGRTREYQERVKVRAAQAQTARAQKLVEMERVRLEAREQVAALERLRMAAEAEHQQLQRQDAEQPARQREIKAARPPIRLRGVFAGAAAATALFTVGILLANFHASTPLSPRLTGSSIKEQMPFGPAAVQAPPAATVAPKIGKSLPEIIRVARPASTPPVVRTARATRPNPEWRHFRKKSTEDDDVVVRHFGPPRKPPTQTAQRQTGIKRYSDQ